MRRLASLTRRDLVPVGALEEMLVENIAVCWWRQKRALRCEAGLVRRAFAPDPGRQLEESLGREMVLGPSPELAAIKDHLSLPLGADLDRILRYEPRSRASWLTPSISWNFTTSSQRRARSGASERSGFSRSVE